MSDEVATRRTVRDLPLTRLLPNMLTLMSLSSGMSGVRFAMQDRWHEAALAIVIAGVFDVLDGRVARMLNSSSKFGAELDSLSDVISFGVAPGLILYLWALKDAGSLGWIAVLLYAVCTALRLARFNTMLEDVTLPVWSKSYFTGVPSPSGAALALLPLFLFLATDYRAPSPLIALWTIFAGALMVSRVPTFALKGWRIPPISVIPIFVGLVFLMAEIITDTWAAFCGITLLYLASLPVGWYSYRRKLKKEGLHNA